MEKSVVGPLINFRGLVYSPINEQGVVFLFGRILEDLNMYIEEVRIKYPDCVARRYTGKGWERIYVEFEYKSSNFKAHEHNPKECNVIVCWEHDWLECPVEVIELKSLIKELPNKEIEEPEKVTLKTKYDLEHHYKRKGVEKTIQLLYEKLHEKIKEVDERIWRKFSKTAITYYGPEKMFVAVRLQKRGVKLHIFTNEEGIEGVKNIRNHTNWGEFNLKREEDFNTAVNAIGRSYKIMREAIKNNINTGWYAKTPKGVEDRKISPENM